MAGLGGEPPAGGRHLNPVAGLQPLRKARERAALDVLHADLQAFARCAADRVAASHFLTVQPGAQGRRPERRRERGRGGLTPRRAPLDFLALFGGTSVARVTVEDCLATVDNRFALVILAAERARQISKGSPPTITSAGGVRVTIRSTSRRYPWAG